MDENSRLYRSTDAFDWGKWHREQGVLVTSLAKRRGNTSFPGPIMVTLKCTDKGAKQQSKLDSPEDWESLMESLEHWVVDLRRKGIFIDMTWPSDKVLIVGEHKSKRTEATEKGTIVQSPNQTNKQEGTSESQICQSADRTMGGKVCHSSKMII